MHVHHGEALGLVAAMKLARVATPVLLTLHVSARGLRRSLAPYRVDGRRLGADEGRLLHRVVGMRVRGWLDRAALALADQVSFISQSAAVDVLGAARAEHAVVVYNGLPEPVDCPGEVPERADLLFVGTYTVRKRPHLLPLVLARVRERMPECRMRVVGFAPEPGSELLRTARALGVQDAFVFEGPLPAADLARLYRASRVLLVPSAYEGLPMVILEALQQGVPCVATRVSGHPEVIRQGENGILVSVDRPHEMADAALQILEDPALARRMGEAGRTVVAERFTLERQTEEYLGLYRRLRAEGALRRSGASARAAAMDGPR